ILDAPFVHVAGGQLFAADQIAQPRDVVRVYLVVVVRAYAYHQRTSLCRSSLAVSTGSRGCCSSGVSMMVFFAWASASEDGGLPPVTSDHIRPSTSSTSSA